MRSIRPGWLSFVLFLTVVSVSSSSAAERLCDPSFEDCRTPLLDLIKAETVGIDVAFWFMEDARYSAELIRRHDAGVRVRVLVDPRVNPVNDLNRQILDQLATAGIPMRKRVAASGILHWKMMVFAAQNKVEFSGANYSSEAFVPTTPYQNYTDEGIYFSDDPSVVNSFKTRYDDLWTDTVNYANYANISGPLTREHATSPLDPELNFVPLQDYATRAVKQYNLETQGIDVTMYRITQAAHADAMIRAVARNVPVRLITEPAQYRDPNRLWHSYNIDRMYVAGIQIRHRAHAGTNHQKSVVLHGLGLTIFGSSNWTSPSASSQEEHNYFTKKTLFHDWFTAQFDRKWNNSTGAIETKPFVPLPPDKPSYVAPSNGQTGIGSGITLTWKAGYWAHKYDIYIGTSPDPPLVTADLQLGPSESTSSLKTFTFSGLTPGTTYYWKVVSKTMANMTAVGAIWSFTTSGTPPGPGAGDIVLYAAKAPTIVGAWSIVSDGSAAGGSALSNPDRGAAKVVTALASPANYFEMTFNADAGRPYRLWMRGKAANNDWRSDSVHVQFSGAIGSNGAPIYQIGSTSSTVVNIEDCYGCGLAGWGWQDNGYDTGVMGPTIAFSASGPQQIRVQVREDGISIDQIVLSSDVFLSAAPGALKNDATILPESQGGGGVTPAPGEVVLYAGKAATIAGAWSAVADSTAAGGFRLTNPDRGAAKIVTALASPVDYFEMTFTAEAGRPYRLWIRGQATNNNWLNDSVFVQFVGSVDANGNPIYRIGTTSSTTVNVEDGYDCGVSGWGWQDNGYGIGVMGPTIAFAASGPQTLRIQVREDGLSIDQIVLSPGTYLSRAPGPLKNDATILPEKDGSQP